MYLSQFNRGFLILFECSKSEQSVVEKTAFLELLFFDIFFRYFTT